MDWGIKQIGIFMFCVMFVSCTFNDLLQQSLEHAGNNREEQEKVLRHYEDDETKRRAAVFLISNIGGRYATVGERVDEFHHFIDSVYRIRQEEYDIPAIYNTFRKQTQNSYASIRRELDLKHITAEYLIRHIDRSFELWNRPWNSHLSLEEFCEWILPYRLHDEQLESWHDIFRPVFDSLLTDTVHTAAQACAVINNRLKELPIHIALETVRPSAIRPSSLINIKFGLCEDYANLAVYAMRSVGIPVGIETVPHWGNTNNRHTFNVVYDNDGRHYDFSGGEDQPGEHLNRFSHKIPKVYRNRYSAYLGSLAMRCGKEQVPSFFRSPFMEDVTANYPFIGAKDIVLPAIKETKNRFAYLCVFDPQGWTPVAWTERKGNSLRFKSVGPDIVYPLAYYAYNDNSNKGYNDFPYFVASVNGASLFVNPKTKHVWSVDLHRDVINVYNDSLKQIASIKGPDNLKPSYTKLPINAPVAFVGFENGKSYASYVDYYLTDKHDYLVYQGTSQFNLNDLSPVEIFKLDFDGNFLCKYKVGRYVYSISVDNKEEYLYCASRVSMAEPPVILKYKL